MLLPFLLISVASAHVPAFESTSEAYDISDKSWGIYRELKKDESFSVFLDVAKGENISFSVNLAGSQDEKFNSAETYIEVTLLGHNASQIHCDPKFTGWGYEDHTARRLDGGLDQSVTIPQKYDKLHFEPFGVGYYRALAACQGEVPVADSNFTVTVKALKVVPQGDDETKDDVLRISIGAGMAEQFDIIQDILYLPVSITQTWFWDQYLLGFVLSQLLGAAGIVVLIRYYLSPKDTNKRDMYKYKWTKYFMLGVLQHNIVVYIIRLLAVGRWIGYVKHAEDSDFDDLESMNIWIAIIIHIIIPAVFLLLVARFDFQYKKDGYKCAAFYIFHILFIFYCACFLIQTFWLGAVASILLLVIRRRFRKSSYQILPDTTA